MAALAADTIHTKRLLMNITHGKQFWYVLNEKGERIATFRSLSQLTRQIPFLKMLGGVK